MVSQEEPKLESSMTYGNVFYHHFTQLSLTWPRENVAKISKDVGGELVQR